MYTHLSRALLHVKSHNLCHAFLSIRTSFSGVGLGPPATVLASGVLPARGFLGFKESGGNGAELQSLDTDGQ